VQQVLDQLGWRERFAAVIGGDQVARGKPHPEIFLRAATSLRRPAPRCVVLEDSPAGVQAARAAGMACVAVPSAEVSREIFPPADLVVDSLERLTPSLLADVVARAPGARRALERP
jgi:beta-phosphoglucomutase-like phosphatase (HAD superfamily)